MSDPQLFDPDTRPAHQRSGWTQAQMERNAALRGLERSGDPLWKEQALAAVRETALRLEYFHVDAIWETGLAGTVDDRAMGPVLRQAARLGWIKKTNFVRPSVKSHLSGKPVWRSLIWEA